MRYAITVLLHEGYTLKEIAKFTKITEKELIKMLNKKGEPKVICLRRRIK